MRLFKQTLQCGSVKWVWEGRLMFPWQEVLIVCNYMGVMGIYISNINSMMRQSFREMALPN